MIYDIVLAISSQHKNIALKSIKSLQLFSNPRKIFIITHKENFKFFNTYFRSVSSIILIDEDLVIKNMNLRELQNIFVKRFGKTYRSGWYFQQFLKMEISLNNQIADYYLIFDSDSILLESIDFFNQDNSVLITPSNYGFHKPYFKTIKKIIKIDKQVDFSFISEHFMIKKSYMIELINKIKNNKLNHYKSWTYFVLDLINDKDLQASGFSEYETYGNYIASKYKDSFKVRKLKTIRNATKYYGKNPNEKDIFRLIIKKYSIATFEIWHKQFKIKILFYKWIAKIYFNTYNVMYKNDKRINQSKTLGF